MIVKIVKIYLGVSLVLLWAVWVSSFLDSSLVQLIFLKIYRPLPMQSVLTTGFQSIAPVTSKAVPSVLASSVCWSLQCLISALKKRGRWWTLFQAHLFSRAVGREGCCKQITLVSARSVPDTLGLAPLTAHNTQALGRSAGNRLRPALGCMHLPGLSHSGSGTQVVLRGADSLGLRIVPFPGPSSLGVWRAQSL